MGAYVDARRRGWSGGSEVAVSGDDDVPDRPSSLLDELAKLVDIPIGLAGLEGGHSCPGLGSAPVVRGVELLSLPDISSCR